MAGKLILIGCGPGTADLLTLRAIHRIEEADIILYDRLVSEDILKYARPDADVIYVGKGSGDGGIQQADINLRLYDALNDGKSVARLKSGDPMIFGRAAEELAIAMAVGAQTEIVPGVTAALAAAADAHITVTERQQLQSFVVTTGRSVNIEDTPDWENIVKPGVCVAIYMGVAQAWKIQSTLMAAGVPGCAPADWIENAGQPCSRTISTTLENASHSVAQHQVTNPAILLIRYPKSLAASQMQRLKTDEGVYQKTRL